MTSDFNSLPVLNVCNFVLLLALPDQKGIATILLPATRASFGIVGSRITLNLNGTLARARPERSETRDLESIRIAAMSNGTGRTSDLLTIQSTAAPPQEQSASSDSHNV